MSYAYFDEHGIMHVSANEKDAVRYAKLSGKIKYYGGGIKGGYPLYKGDEIIIKYLPGSFSVTLSTAKGDIALAGEDANKFIDYAKGLV